MGHGMKLGVVLDGGDTFISGLLSDWQARYETHLFEFRDFVLPLLSERVNRRRLRYALRKFLNKKTGKPELDKNILDEIVVEMVRSYDKYLTAIGALAAAAPMLGLLGTVLGMIGTFDTMAVFGTGNARSMAGGISEALITTQTGLLVAIPGLYMKSFLENRSVELKKSLAGIGMYIKRNIDI